MHLYPTRLEPARQPEAVAAGFKGNRNPCDLFTGPDRLIAPAMQQAKQPLGWAAMPICMGMERGTAASGSPV